MKITAIKSFVCNARMRNWVFVKVETDQPGLVGWGEATLEWHTRSVVGAVEDLATLLMGEDPRRIEHLWQMMFRQHFWHSSGIVRATAMSGIDFLPQARVTQFLPAGRSISTLFVKILPNASRHHSAVFFVVIGEPSDGTSLGRVTRTAVRLPAGS